MNSNLGKKLEAAYFLDEDVVSLSRSVLGKYLVTNIDNVKTSGMIVETEAYKAPEDKACHAYLNKRTDRTKVMFYQGGHCYVYLCYGIHHLFNIVTGPEDVAHAILIRAIEPAEGIEIMQKRRGRPNLTPQLTAGPGIASKALGITTQYTGLSIVDNYAPIWIEDRGQLIPPDQIIASPRVGVGYAEECALWDWRFRIKGSKWTSKAK